MPTQPTLTAANTRVRCATPDTYLHVKGGDYYNGENVAMQCCLAAETCSPTTSLTVIPEPSGFLGLLCGVLVLALLGRWR